MQLHNFIVSINSADPERLTGFYRDVVGLTLRDDMGPNTFDVCGIAFGIGGHSEIAGPAREPARVLFTLWVDDVAAEEARLDAAGVSFIRRQGKEDWGGVISTFTDPDGNYMQIMQLVPEAEAVPA